MAPPWAAPSRQETNRKHRRKVMIKRISSFMALLTVTAVLLSACGTTASDTPTSVPAPTDTAAPPAAAATATTAPPAATDTTAPAATATTAASGGSGKIAILLPETKTARYESQDLPNFKAKLTALGFDVANLIYSNANQDASTQQSQAEAALTNGAKVLVLDPVDSAAAAAIADLAKSKGVPVISYDRLITGSDAVGYYISFDNAQVGKLQGTSLLTALAGKTNPTIVMINGDPADNNAKLF